MNALSPPTLPNKAEALQIGALHYVTGTPCGRGHLSPRYTRGGACVECVRLVRGGWLKTRKRSPINMDLALAARDAGETTFVPLKPCPKGHSLRFIASNNCVQCDLNARARDVLKRKFARIRKEYGLTNQQYLDLVAAQNSACRICSKVEADHFRLHIDHCHSTSKVRGLLCGPCNQGIGLLRHSTEILQAAQKYLLECGQ